MAETLSISIEQAQPARRTYGLYAGIAALGAFLWWMSTYRMAAMPFWAPWDFSPLWYIAATLAIYWHARGLARTPPAERPALWRTVFYYIGIAAIWIVLQTRFEYMAQHMFFLNRIQHVVMHHLGPFLIALAWPGATLTRGMPEPVLVFLRSRPVRTVTAIVQQPFLAAVLFFGLIALWLTPPIHFRAMIDPTLYSVMNWSMVVDGLFFWCLVLDPRPAPPAFASFAIDDQQYGGLIVWIPSSMMSVIALIIVINFLRQAEEKQWKEEDEGDAMGPVISSWQWTGR